MRSPILRTVSISSATSTFAPRLPRACIVAKWLQSRGYQDGPSPYARGHNIPLRKHLKEQAKAEKAGSKRKKAEEKAAAKHPPRAAAETERWELTVGIEIHAELNTACKLFSSAPAAAADSHALPNTNVAPFDAALPGTQPQFQVATLLPALRAAIALDCDVQRTSGWDRKHYFHWDQPNGYQITQYYQPFAKDGRLRLRAEDGVPKEDLNGAEEIEIGIKQIQMEQDTAKTTNHPPSTYHVDLNRAGHPLIEIITLPQIHSPQAAAAVVRKIQGVLKSVDACVTGMELGGLRADVNVSVQKQGATGSSQYSGVTGLGQRTEIKNLSSFVAIENAIVAERDRQISVLKAGGVIEGETRGWTLGATETTRLRGKEGEVDYRYMPDADLPPLRIGSDLVAHLKETLPELPDQTVERVQKVYGLSAKDAKTIASLDDGDRLEYLEETVQLLSARVGPGSDFRATKLGKTVGNWILHELGGLITTSESTWQDCRVSETELADLIANVLQRHITSRTAKQLLATLHNHPPDSDRPSVEQLVEDGNLRLRPLSEEGYVQLAEEIIAENQDLVKAGKGGWKKSKTMWFVGQMMRRGEEGTVEPEKAREVVESVLGVGEEDGKEK
ncbi:uncharacterized protein LTR77_006205 [Saxophila tyrrhenica]|uniref:Glutamyl-tRNA(Gln) amidotransferase subunit B, mitochondrial n=1 Tax=Saxophila tyrrhenica TaxID=1690608 RepID=A0AAV9P7H6_9PEZI|nr:hypothetical protein LTR77_006205 [Saxophila tyrrhenica]